MKNILSWIWLIFFVIVLAKAYYDILIDIIAWIKKKIYKAREAK